MPPRQYFVWVRSIPLVMRFAHDRHCYTSNVMRFWLRTLKEKSRRSGARHRRTLLQGV